MRMLRTRRYYRCSVRKVSARRRGPLRENRINAYVNKYTAECKYGDVLGENVNYVGSLTPSQNLN